MARTVQRPIGAHTTKNAKTIALSYPSDHGNKYGYKERYIPKTPANLKKVKAMFSEHQFDGKNHIWY